MEKIYVVFDPTSDCHRVEYLDLNDPQDVSYALKMGYLNYAIYEASSYEEAEIMCKEFESMRR
ncbi:MAG: hypothetical protein DRP03_03895 [Candidatus Aenigmatarchaeota archaeon]|nr:MAG: hypothetical protein DRP03_03895 [Candidatus Aenigmarchaeota archaeon]